MRKLIILSSLLFFIWLVLDTYHLHEAFLNFLLVGEVPGMQTPLSPGVMLAIMTTIAGIILFELFARQLVSVWRTRGQLIKLAKRGYHLPSRRFGRINQAS